MNMKKLALTGLSLAMASAITLPAHAEVSASAGVASSYFWRGQDLGDGNAAVFGDLVYSQQGAYVGTWVSSGDGSNGNEYDFFVGYGGEVENFSYDVSLVTYVYPDANVSDDTTGDLSELVVSLGFGPVSFTIYDNIANSDSSEGYFYYTLGAEFGQFSATLGQSAGVEVKKLDENEVEVLDAQGRNVMEDNNYTHLDVSYAYNDNLTFTVSKIFDQDIDNSYDDDMQMVVSYSLPIE